MDSYQLSKERRTLNSHILKYTDGTPNAVPSFFYKKMNFTKYGAIEKNNIVLGNYALNIILSKKLFMVPIL